MPYSMTEAEQTSILIVDDRVEHLIVMEAFLKDSNLNIVKAKSGYEAFDRMMENDFALVLLDVQMPGINGFQTAELMRRNERTKEVPIIFVTAISKEERYIFKGYESGAVDYILKPVDPHVLQSKVKVFVRLHRQNIELKRTVSELQKALEEIKTIRGIIPICMYCKQIKNDTGSWDKLEIYIEEHSDADFSHGICPDCMKEQMAKIKRTKAG